MRIKNLSAVVICYNRCDVVEACLVAASRAEQLIVVDKSSTDGTADIARRYATEFYSVPWSPVVEDTRAFAASKVTNDWILMLDDDECLNTEAIDFIADYVQNPISPICYLPLRHYVIGRHDPRAYYWPEVHGRLFRRDVVRFPDKVHSGIEFGTDDKYYLPVEHGAAILHLSHADSYTWIEKTNRYTSIANRKSSANVDHLTSEGMKGLLDKWLNKVPDGDDPYLCAVSTLKAIYEMIDVIKQWEAQQGNVGRSAFVVEANRIIAEHHAKYLPKTDPTVTSATLSRWLDGQFRAVINYLKASRS